MITESQESELVSGGDCRSHFHLEDRVPTQAFLHGLQTVVSRKTYTGDTTLTSSDDYALVDTRTATITVTLPQIRSSLEVEVLKLYSQNVLVVIPASGDTIMGSTGITVSSGGSALHFKAFGTDWRLV